MCKKSGFGLQFWDNYILVGGSAHDLMSKDAQQEWLSKIEEGQFHFCICSPPCGTWSRSNWANNSGPQPCRDRKHPWGIPGQRRSQQKRADMGNEFIHFAIRMIKAAGDARHRGFMCRSLLEHPEDLGRTHRGTPASIFQLSVVREAHEGHNFISVAGHRCQFRGCDRKKPTRLLSDIMGLTCFGYPGWPSFDPAGYYLGPLPRDCGHEHLQRMIGRNARGGFHTAPTAAYPAGMCKMLAEEIFKEWMQHINKLSTCGM